MKILNELVGLANKANAAGQGTPEMVDFRVTANPDTIIAIAEAFRALEQEKEAAEAHSKSLTNIIDTRETDLRTQAVDIECALQLIKRLERQVLEYQAKLAELEKQERKDA